MKCEVVKIKCEKCKGNPDGFVEVNADAMPEGAELFVEGEEGQSGPNEGTVDWIKLQLDEKQVSYDGVTKKADLQELQAFKAEFAQFKTLMKSQQSTVKQTSLH